jgi:hypothetical protein
MKSGEAPATPEKPTTPEMDQTTQAKVEASEGQPLLPLAEAKAEEQSSFSHLCFTSLASFCTFFCCRICSDPGDIDENIVVTDKISPPSQ